MVSRASEAVKGDGRLKTVPVFVRLAPNSAEAFGAEGCRDGVGTRDWGFGIRERLTAERVGFRLVSPGLTPGARTACHPLRGFQRQGPSASQASIRLRLRINRINELRIQGLREWSFRRQRPQQWGPQRREAGFRLSAGSSGGERRALGSSVTDVPARPYPICLRPARTRLGGSLTGISG
jgi:hypothetical protein